MYTVENSVWRIFMAVTMYHPQWKTKVVRGVLFDMDGLVLDTEKLYSRFWMEAANDLGFPMTYEQALGMRSLNRHAGQARLTEYFGPGISYSEVRNRRIERMDAWVDIHGVDLKPGIRELLDYLHDNGIACAITTSSPWTEPGNTSLLITCCTGSTNSAAVMRFPKENRNRISIFTAPHP